MPFVTSHMSISLDGFVAGPDQSEDNPLGIDGRKLHDWHLNDPKHPVDEAFTQRLLGPRGAYIMGRNMFGPVRGGVGRLRLARLVGSRAAVPRSGVRADPSPARPDRDGRWDDLLLRRRLRHRPAEAAKVAGDRPIDIAGGASAVRQALQAGCLNELVLDIIPVVLGHGERLFDGVPELHAEPVEVATSPLATHLVYRIS